MSRKFLINSIFKKFTSFEDLRKIKYFSLKLQKFFRNTALVVCPSFHSNLMVGLFQFNRVDVCELLKTHEHHPRKVNCFVIAAELNDTICHVLVSCYQPSMVSLLSFIKLHQSTKLQQILEIFNKSARTTSNKF